MPKGIGYPKKGKSMPKLAVKHKVVANMKRGRSGMGFRRKM